MYNFTILGSNICAKIAESRHCEPGFSDFVFDVTMFNTVCSGGGLVHSIREFP
jgi:hypothetical protein